MDRRYYKQREWRWCILPKIKLSGVHYKGHKRKSDFAIQATVADELVHFDRLFAGQERTLIIHATHRGARAFGQWLLDNVPE